MYNLCLYFNLKNCNINYFFRNWIYVYKKIKQPSEDLFELLHLTKDQTLFRINCSLILIWLLKHWLIETWKLPFGLFRDVKRCANVYENKENLRIVRLNDTTI